MEVRVYGKRSEVRRGEERRGEERRGEERRGEEKRRGKRKRTREMCVLFLQELNTIIKSYKVSKKKKAKNNKRRG
jgi:hypothetical protein